MASDPFAYPKSQDLETSTSMTIVDQNSMDHAAGEAARLVKAAVSNKSSKPGRKSKTSVASAHGEVATSLQGLATRPIDLAEVMMETAPPAVEPNPETQANVVAPALGAASEATHAIAEIAVPGPDTLSEAPTPPEDAAESVAAPAPELAKTMLDASHEAVTTALQSTETAVETMVEALADQAETMAGIVEGSSERMNAIASSGASQEVDALKEFRAKLAQTLYANTEAAVAFWTSLLEVRSPSKAIELNATHLARQMESFMSQSLEFFALARKAGMISMTSLTGPVDRLRE